MLLEAELPGGLLLQNSKFIRIQFFTFQKILKKYRYTWRYNAQLCKIFRTKYVEMRAVKKTGFLTHDNIPPPRLWICLFCTDHISRYFILKFYTHTHNILVYLHNFFSDFFETEKFEFWFVFKKRPPWLPGAKRPFSFISWCI